ncbi:bacterial Ig-like domain-containing protein [Lactococcus termiticola]|uniref:Cell surface protein n=1 Tax=Lactococcus termiticola TaxID=2169526 RepID=A0A2R5HJA5_9LACT|nr:bacterial Ig-like domain-containing protein [Lactococcus termiticola]GBG96281.1 cell surface protein [Lactococcus termiticola]
MKTLKLIFFGLILLVGLSLASPPAEAVTEQPFMNITGQMKEADSKVHLTFIKSLGKSIQGTTADIQLTNEATGQTYRFNDVKIGPDDIISDANQRDFEGQLASTNGNIQPLSLDTSTRDKGTSLGEFGEQNTAWLSLTGLGLLILIVFCLAYNKKKRGAKFLGIVLFVIGTSLSPQTALAVSEESYELKQAEVLRDRNWKIEVKIYTNSLEEMSLLRPASPISTDGGSEQKPEPARPLTPAENLKPATALKPSKPVEPEDLTNLIVHDSQIKLGDDWKPEDNFDSAQSKIGELVNFSEIQVSGEVDSMNLGDYTIRYSYAGKQELAKVTVALDPAYLPTIDPDDPLAVHYLGLKWSIIRDPETLGDKHYLIALDQNIGRSSFSSAPYFYDNNDLKAPDNQGIWRESTAQQLINNWYNQNIQGTDFERSVLPASLPNPSLSDAKAYCDFWKLPFESNEKWGKHLYSSGYDVPMTTSERFRTRFDKENGIKSAFLMSGSDICDDEGDGAKIHYMTPEAVRHAEKYRDSTGIHYAYWLRSPGCKQQCASLGMWGYSTAVDQHWGIEYENDMSYVGCVLPGLIVKIQ